MVISLILTAKVCLVIRQSNPSSIISFSLSRSAEDKDDTGSVAVNNYRVGV
jgi:hypothetical protein